MHALKINMQTTRVALSASLWSPDLIASVHPRYDHVQKAASAAVVQRNLSHVRLVVSPKTKVRTTALVVRTALTRNPVVKLLASHAHHFSQHARMDVLKLTPSRGMIQGPPPLTRRLKCIHVSMTSAASGTTTTRKSVVIQATAIMAHSVVHAIGTLTLCAAEAAVCSAGNHGKTTSQAQVLGRHGSD